MQLATHPDELAIICQKLQAHRDTLPLFQPQQWVANLEAVFWELWDQYQRE